LGDWKLIHYYEDSHEELYNLKNDLEETTNVAAANAELVIQLSETANAELVIQLSEKLFTMLNEMGARYPTRDPEWTAEKESKYLENIVNKRWPQLEKQRMDFLSKDYDPGNNWWGSMVTKD